MPDIVITAADDARVALYRGVADPALVVGAGRFIAEGRLVVRRLLASSSIESDSVLVTPAARAALDDVLAPRQSTLPVYVASHEILSGVAGFHIHRGCLALGRRPVGPGLDEVVAADDRPVLVLALDGVGNADNVGGLFRCARAFGVDAVVLGPGTVDPYYRKAIRTSMGAVFDVPGVRVDELASSLSGLRAVGLEVVALSPDGLALDPCPVLPAAGRIRAVLVVGQEGQGLTPSVRATVSSVVRVAMAPQVDSLNVVVAGAIALHHFARAMGRVL